MPEDKKSTYKGSTDAMRKAVAKYHSEKIETIAVRVPVGRKEYYKQAAAARGMSLNAFAIYAMDALIQGGKPAEGALAEGADPEE